MTDAPETPRPRSAGSIPVRVTGGPRALMGPGGVTPPARWRAQVLTLFPGMFPGPLGESLVGRALQTGVWGLEAVDIRSFATNKHRTVDDTPAGGGPGMVLKPDILAAAIDHSLRGAPRRADGSVDRDRWAVIALSPRGRPMTQARAHAIAAGDGATLICGRFEGFDQRALDARGVEEICIGDFVMTGGEIPAMALIDSVVRLLPGAIGKIESTEDESFSAGLLEHPHYTRPVDWEGMAIPEVLLSGHHGQIAKWRQAQAEATTQERRPDLWRAHQERIAASMSGPDGGAEQSDRKPDPKAGGR